MRGTQRTQIFSCTPGSAHHSYAVMNFGDKPRPTDGDRQWRLDITHPYSRRPDMAAEVPKLAGPGSSACGIKRSWPYIVCNPRVGLAPINFRAMRAPSGEQHPGEEKGLGVMVTMKTGRCIPTAKRGDSTIEGWELLLRSFAVPDLRSPLSAHIREYTARTERGWPIAIKTNCGARQQLYRSQCDHASAYVETRVESETVEPEA
jgi:hypothetical protein